MFAVGQPGSPGLRTVFETGLKQCGSTPSGRGPAAMYSLSLKVALKLADVAERRRRLVLPRERHRAVAGLAWIAGPAASGGVGEHDARPAPGEAAVCRATHPDAVRVVVAVEVDVRVVDDAVTVERRSPGRRRRRGCRRSVATGTESSRRTSCGRRRSRRRTPKRPSRVGSRSRPRRDSFSSSGLTSIDVSFCGKQLYSVLARWSSPLSLSFSTSSRAVRRRLSGSTFIRACGHSVIPEPRSTSRNSQTPEGPGTEKVFSSRGSLGCCGGSSCAGAGDAPTTSSAATNVVVATRNRRIISPPFPPRRERPP